MFILVKNNLVSEAQPDLDTDCEVIWVRIKQQNTKDALIGTFYMPHRREKDVNKLKESLKKTSAHNKQIILVGDFNCPDVDWETNSAPPGAPDRLIQQAVADATNEHHLTQIHSDPTRQNRLLDLVFVSNPTLVKHSTSTPGLGDHHAVVTDLNSKPFITRQPPRTVYQFQKADWGKIDDEAIALTQDMETQYKAGADAQSLWDMFKNGIMKATHNHVPSHTLKIKGGYPWINRSIKRMLAKKRRLYKKAKKSKNWNNYIFFQKECDQALKKAEDDYINKTISEGFASNNPRPFWRFIKQRGQDNTGVAPLYKQGKLISDSKSKAQIMLDQFKSVFTIDTSASTTLTSNQDQPKIDSLYITSYGVEKLLRDLNPSKACGPDGIPNIVLKKCAPVLAPALRDIFQRSIDTGVLPDDWRKANISCAYKKGDKHRAENYRPISLTSVCCKLLEHIVYRHLMSHLQHHSILTPLNHGFRAGHSCVSQLLTTVHDLLRSYDKKKQVDVMILDFSKAFDTVPHDKLLSKLQSYGIDGNIHNWIKNFLVNRTMRVVLEGASSTETRVLSGVPQGTVLGPLLFLCHLNDLPDVVSSQVRLFADDCLVYREINSIHDQIKLQEDLRKLEQWASEWGMRFNASKCYVLSIQATKQYFYQLNNTILKQVTSNPYLGVQLSSDLKWDVHINHIAKRANSKLGFLRRNIHSFPLQCKRMAYLSLVRSSIEYSSVVWDPYYQKDIERLEGVQNAAVRFIVNDYKTRDTGFITSKLQELQLPTLQARRHHARLALFRKVVDGQMPSLPPGNFLVPARSNQRRIRARNFDNCVTQNIVERRQTNNPMCFKVPDAVTDNYKNSFFVKTVCDWNSLREEEVNSLLSDTDPILSQCD